MNHCGDANDFQPVHLLKSLDKSVMRVGFVIDAKAGLHNSKAAPCKVLQDGLGLVGRNIEGIGHLLQ